MQLVVVVIMMVPGVDRDKPLLGAYLPNSIHKPLRYSQITHLRSPAQKLYPLLLHLFYPLRLSSV